MPSDTLSPLTAAWAALTDDDKADVVAAISDRAATIDMIRAMSSTESAERLRAFASVLDAARLAPVHQQRSQQPMRKAEESISQHVRLHPDTLSAGPLPGASER